MFLRKRLPKVACIRLSPFLPNIMSISSFVLQSRTDGIAEQIKELLFLWLIPIFTTIYYSLNIYHLALN